jgi:hypothetical protein
MAITDHVPVPPDLRLESEFEDVYGYLDLVDPDLRIRKSVEHEGVYIIERRCRRAPAVNTGMYIRSDAHLQARDGYIHVASTRTIWLTKPWNMVRALREDGADLWAAGGAAKFCTEQEYEEAWTKETVKRRRRGLFRDIASDQYDTVRRMNIDGSRMRISNPWGGGKATHADFLGASAGQAASA